MNKSLDKNIEQTVKISYMIFFTVLIFLIGCSKDSSGVSQDDGMGMDESDQNTILEFNVTQNNLALPVYIDESNRTILIEYSGETDLENLQIGIQASPKSTLEPNVSGTIDMSDGTFTLNVIAENGDQREYSISAYSKNLLINPTGNNVGEFWSFNGNTGVTEYFDGRNEFYIIRHDDGTENYIEQRIEFNRNYSDKYILFIGEMTTEKTVEGSITRHPYFWGHQFGPFNFDDDPYEEVIQGGMIHTGNANIWEVVYKANLLLPEVESVLLKLGQASRSGDAPDGTKCKFRDIEVRIFESSEAAEIYVLNLYH